VLYSLGGDGQNKALHNEISTLTPVVRRTPPLPLPTSNWKTLPPPCSLPPRPGWVGKPPFFLGRKTTTSPFIRAGSPVFLFDFCVFFQTNSFLRPPPFNTTVQVFPLDLKGEVLNLS